jgi:hypothetical protein
MVDELPMTAEKWKTPSVTDETFVFKLLVYRCVRSFTKVPPQEL